MPLEIERKFLVHADRLPRLEFGVSILQGYLSLEPQVRFRIEGDTVTLAVKSRRTGNTRFEFEASRPKVGTSDCMSLRELAVLPLIEKTRYRIPEGELIWEIDQYSGKNSGLITAEVELPRSDYSLPIPEWIRGDAEITYDERYFNTRLATCPFTGWEKTEF
ncbi:MAG: adenylate cyclase [Candidatus Riflebacteria bacterium]|nr:adenylate cyclase [Candidatus Riflebacteria bacterium]